MKIAGDNTIPFPVGQVWDALLDPQVLVATIPGCERLEATGENTYDMTVTAGVAAIKGTYSGTCALSDLRPHESLVMRLQGAGAPGTIDATVDVSFSEAEPGVTRVTYAADAVVGGMVGGVGQRMLGSVSGGWPGSSSATSVAPSRAPVAGSRPPSQPVGERRRPRRPPARSSPLRRVRPGSPPRRLPQGRCRGGRPGPRRCDRRRGLRAPTVTAALGLTVDSTAREMAAAVRNRQISARELLELHLARIAERNPQLNALVSLDEERARAGAAAADEALAAGAAVGPLHGLPHAFKDTHDVAGWRTTYGSPLYADHVPDTDLLLVERIRAAGAVPIGKTNVPEFAAGSHTFNRVFGTTLNPVDPTRSAGGSSGGAGCALAAGMVPLADGSDIGGSLRNPASFCGVVGLRPSLGRVPEWPVRSFWDSLSTGGPMARNVGDLALLLSVIAGPDPRTPTALGDPGATFSPPLAGQVRGLRVAVSTDLGGAFAVDPEVADVVRVAAGALTDAGATVTEDHPDLGPADEVFRTLRAWQFQAAFAGLLAEQPDGFKASLADNIRAGASLTGPDIARAFATRTALMETTRRFFDDYDVLILPTCQVPPFPADQEFPPTIDGQPMESYLDWMRSAYLVTVTGSPALSLPGGSTAQGLPVGVQLVAAHGADRRLLEIASGCEPLLVPMH